MEGLRLPYERSENAIELWETHGDLVLLFYRATVDQAVIDRLVRGNRVERVDFRGATFAGPVSFAGVEFSGPVLSAVADFTGAVFEDTVDFSGATVDETRNVSFDQVRFKGFANFSGFAGGRYVLFGRTNFDAGCSFRSAHFPPMARFDRVHFEGPADFSGVHLGAKFTAFHSCVFDAGLNDLTKSLTLQAVK